MKKLNDEGQKGTKFTDISSLVNNNNNNKPPSCAIRAVFGHTHKKRGTRQQKPRHFPSEYFASAEYGRKIPHKTKCELSGVGHGSDVSTRHQLEHQYGLGIIALSIPRPFTSPQDRSRSFPNLKKNVSSPSSSTSSCKRCSKNPFNRQKNDNNKRKC